MLFIVFNEQDILNYLLLLTYYLYYFCCIWRYIKNLIKQNELYLQEGSSNMMEGETLSLLGGNEWALMWLHLVTSCTHRWAYWTWS